MSDIGFGEVGGIAGGIIVTLIIISVVIYLLRRVRPTRVTPSAPPQRSQERIQHPIQPHWAPPHVVQVPGRQHVNERQYQTPLHDSATGGYSAPPPPWALPLHQRPVPQPTAPPTTYNPQHTHVLITQLRTRTQTQTQPTQQSQPQFSSEDLLSFEATGTDKESPCPICLGPLEEEPISTGQCLHLMHTSCLKSWLAKDARSACPVCRLPYSDELQNPTHAPSPAQPAHAPSGAAPT